MQGVLGVFHHLDATVTAIEELKKNKLGDVTVYSPTIRHELDDAIAGPNSVVRRFTLIGGLLGVRWRLVGALRRSRGAAVGLDL